MCSSGLLGFKAMFSKIGAVLLKGRGQVEVIGRRSGIYCRQLSVAQGDQGL